MHCFKRCKIISEHVGFERDWLNKNVFFLQIVCYSMGLPLLMIIIAKFVCVSALIRLSERPY